MVQSIYSSYDIFLITELIFIAILLIYYCINIRLQNELKISTNKYFLGYILLLSWSILSLFEIIAPNQVFVIIFRLTKFGVLMYVGYIFMLFEYEFTLRKPINRKLRVTFNLVIGTCYLPVIVYKLIGNIFLDTEVIFFVNISIISIFILVLGIGILYYIIRLRIIKVYYKQKQIYYFAFSYGIPLLVYIITIIDLTGNNYLVLTTILLFYIILMIFITNRYHILNPINPLLDFIVENLRVGILIIGQQKEIIDYNKSFFLPTFNIENYKTAHELMEDVKKITLNKLALMNIFSAIDEVERYTITGEINLMIDSNETTYAYIIKSIYDSYNIKRATMITFYNISDIKKVYQSIDEQNNKLMVIKEKIEEHMLNLESLTIEKERDSLMKEINDTLGHSITELLALLEKCGILIEKNNDEVVVEKAINEVINRGREGLREIRLSVAKYREGVNEDD